MSITGGVDMLDFYTASDPIVEVFFWIGVVSMAMVLFLIVQIIALRLLFSFRQRRKRVARLRWRSAMLGWLAGEEVSLSPLRGYVFDAVIDLWCRMFEAVNDADYRQRMIDFAHRYGLVERARVRLRARDLRIRLRALRALGDFGEADDWSVLERFLDDTQNIVSLSAMEALVHLDADRAIEPLLRRLSSHRHWPRDRLAGLFQEIGADRLSAPLADWMLRASPTDVVRLIRYLELIHARDALRVARAYLHDHDENIVAGCVYLLGRIPLARSLAMVRPLVRHPSWVVRTQVAIALGRIGNRDDVARLLQLAEDRNRWVRVRAVQAIISLPDLDRENIRRMIEHAPDRFAHDALLQALTERTVVA